MKKISLLIPLFLFAFSTPVSSFAQGIMGGHVTGNIQFDGQISRRDTVIGSSDVPQKLLSNARADILYTNGNFNAGIRYEAYLAPMLGFRPDYEGQGIANYFVSYKKENFGITAGYFYEQFGNGLSLRAYEDRYLGIDNALRGINVMYRPINGLILKGVVGTQRYFWDNNTNGLVRGLDAELCLNDIVKPWNEAKTRLTFGGSFVSKYENSDAASIPAEISGFKVNLPNNVATAAVRMDLARGGFGLQAEYAHKSQDPNDLNNYIFREGNVLWLSASYSQKGLSANIQAKRVDNMGFRSARTEQYTEMLFINYTPAISKQHTYSFLSMYPYATQSMGEMGLQGDFMYKFKKETLLGGKYGTDIHLNASLITGLDTSYIGGRGTEGYTSDFFGTGDTYYGDVSLELSKKLSSKVKFSATYGFVVFNPIIEGHAGDLHHNNVVVADLTWKLNKKNSIRFEVEWMGSDSKYDASIDDKRAGDWIMGLVEYNFAGSWFVSLSDQYAYNDGIGNYYNISVGYTKGATRLTVGYGKQREGIICIGGVCRNVPASNGLTFSLTTSF